MISLLEKFTLSCLAQLQQLALFKNINIILECLLQQNLKLNLILDILLITLGSQSLNNKLGHNLLHLMNFLVQMLFPWPVQAH